MWERHARSSRHGTRDEGLAAVIAPADAAGDVDRAVSMVLTVDRTHQHATNLPRAESRPISHDREIHEHRNVVEGSFALLRQWRALATRYDEHVLIYRGAVVLAAVLAWTRT